MNPLIRIFMEGGIMMWPLILILLVVGALIVSTLLRLELGGGNDTIAIQRGLDGLLFWGGFAIVTGVLGSTLGLFKSIATVAKLGLSSPRALWIGVAESMISTIAGLAILAIAAIFWYLLRWRFLRTQHPRQL